MNRGRNVSHENSGIVGEGLGVGVGSFSVEVGCEVGD
jgi:hypothetical protein